MPGRRQTQGIETKVRDLGAGRAVPLYHRIFLQLRDQILRGERAYGTALPTEHELAGEKGVSRITARRALDELAQAGLVSRRRRFGTHVTHRGRPASIEANLEQALDTLIDFGRNTQVRVLSIETVAASAEVARALEIAPGTPVVEAVRMRDRGGEPLGRVTSHAIRALGAVLTRDGLVRRPLLSLVQEHGHAIGSGSETIGARLADDAIAAALAIEWHSPLLTIERVVRGTDGAPLLRTFAEYRADRYRIALALNAGAHG